ncbi:MAG: ATPase involved in DNA repair SbcC [Candidatus Methanohalarchaeum thermophilum]|uniref:Chromosome partition protein Smc n=1 Tax=Methanohalarchaeum thermophilum TaxID=1903181 RepID=A0A1Q6DXC3_METT1|nr:MAG: ATPase involved in DNA repair SbcC [Candidatus Methanohalarchaeum thermophilum]
MKIKEIKLKNFKSFANKTVIPFKEGFNAISGPNGSGKSNIIDAICFVLGTTTTKGMRADDLTDLIHDSENGKNPNYAKVTLKIKNEGDLPLDRDEVTFTRKVKETKSGHYSYFYLNGDSVNLGDIQDVISKAGVSREGYNVVMQGDVTRIIEMTSKSRREIIDEIAGISEFDDKKERAMDELEKVKEKIERVNLIISEIKDRLDELKKEKEQAKKFKELKDKKNDLKNYLKILTAKKIEKEIKNLDDLIEEKEIEKDNFSQELTDIKKKISVRQEDLEKINSRISEKAEEEKIKVKRQIEETKGKISKQKDKISLFKEKIDEKKEEKNKNYKKKENLKKEIEDLKKEKNNKKINKKNIENEIKELTGQKEDLEQKLNEIDNKSLETKEKISNIKEEKNKLQESKNKLLREKDRILDSLRRKEDQIEDINESIENLKQRKSDNKEEIQKLEDEISDIVKKKENLIESKKELDEELRQKKKKIDSLKKEIKQKKDKLTTLKTKAKAAKKINKRFSRPVKEILNLKRKSKNDSIFGTISDLGSVKDKYSKAVSAAAGGGMQSIVVKNDEVAQECINFLKKNNYGRATFLPLNKINPKPPRRKAEKVLKNDDAIDLAINLIDFNSKLKPAFWYVFGDTVVMKNLESARKVMGGVKITTLDGDLLSSRGAISGGSNKKPRFEFSEKNEEKVEELEQELSKLKKQKDVKLKDLKNLQEALDRVKSKIEDKKTKLELNKSKLDESRKTLEDHKKEIKNKKERKEAILSEKKEQKSSINEKEQELNNLNSEIQDKQKKIEKLEEKVNDEKVPKLMKNLDNIKKKIDRFKESKKDLEGELDNIEMKTKYKKEKMTELDQKRKDLSDEIKELKDKLEEKNKEIKELKNELESKKSKDNSLDDELKELRNKRDDLLKKINELEDKQSLKEKKISEKENRIKKLHEKIKNKKQKIAELNIDEKEIDFSEEYDSKKQVKKQVNRLNEQIDELKPVNMRAIKEYDKVKERKEYLGERVQTLKEEREGIIERIEKYEKRKKEVFMQTFKDINQNFQEIFEKLSPDGKAELVLENEEDPFEEGLTIKARPAGKNIRKLNAMSGGEKSLTALSFLFAIQRHDPSPFYAFDEIDMFLDGANVERVANMIEKLSERAQYIVVSLREPTIESADQVVGITMQEEGISEATGVDFNGN